MVSTRIYKSIITIIGIILFLIIVDFLLFHFQNTIAFSTIIINFYALNPLVSWTMTILFVSLVAMIMIGIINRRREFLQSLRDELDDAERITIVDLAQKLDVTPAKVEQVLNSMVSSKVRHFPGLIIISSGKHVYLGEKLLTRIIELYEQEYTRGEIAGSLQLVRADLDKAIIHLAEKGIIEDREEKRVEKVRPSYRKGTR
jgi:hypothetical protein